MDISMRMLGRVDVVDLSGRAEVDDHLDLRESFLDSIERGRKNFIVNLSDATSLDSMMLGEVVACFKRAREHGGDVRLVVSPDGIAHNLIQLTGLDRVFRVYGDESAAAAEFVTGPS